MLVFLRDVEIIIVSQVASNQVNKVAIYFIPVSFAACGGDEGKRMRG